MGWGVLDDNKTAQPPGTIIFDDIYKLPEEISVKENASLKRVGDIILEPQPSNSPNDPLNWSTKFKLLVFLTLITANLALGGINAMLSTAGRILAEEFDVRYANIVRSLQPPAIAAGAIALFFASAFAAVWGKRLTIFVSIVLVWVCMLGGYFANSLNSYRVLSILTNVLGAPTELLTVPILTDLIFVHQRGKFVVLFGVVTIIGIDVSQVVTGNIITKLGIKYLYIISFGVLVPVMIGVFFFVPETTYHRQPTPHSTAKLASSMSDINLTIEETKQSPTVTVSDAKLAPVASEASFVGSFVSSFDDDEQKHSTSSRLRLYHGRVSDRSFAWAFFQPFTLVFFPPVLFSSVVSGAMLTWVVIGSIISGQVLLYSPYNIKSNTLAYLGLPGSGIAVIFSLVAGCFSDWLIKFMAKRNGGIYEPEFRLLMLIPAVILSTAGFLLIGPMYAREAPVYQLVLVHLLFSAAMPFGTAACTTYLLDTMQEMSAEAFVATILFKSLCMVLATYLVPGWFATYGPVTTFRWLAVVNLILAAPSVPMYVFGKRWRGLVVRNAFLKRTAGQ